MKKKILHQAKKKNIFFDKTFKKIYISRIDARNKRSFKDNVKIEKFLIKKGFKILVLSKYSF